MASFKLRVENKTTLYYGKFNYKLIIRYKNLRYTHFSKTLDDLITKYNADRDFLKSRNRKSYIYDLDPLDATDIEALGRIYDLKEKFKGDNSVAFRKEGDALSLFSNDLDVLKDAAEGFKNAKFYVAQKSPTGVMYFKEKPPALYRAYMTGKKITLEDKQELISYILASPSIKTSQALQRRFLSGERDFYLYTSSSYYLDFDDEQLVTLLKIKFPSMFGKVYKLEQR